MLERCWLEELDGSRGSDIGGRLQGLYVERRSLDFEYDKPQQAITTTFALLFASEAGATQG